ncbi:hypothetical protein [Gemmatimonas sp.]|jgi:hypothetical protein|uniref:hypothetical protein n=1 Tax=Gemmatimonas sp. TaxID=1962908 RepID=UPI00391F4321
MAFVAFWLGLFGFASVALIVWRAETLVHAVLAQRAKAVDADVALKQAPPKKIPLPPDLEALAMEETEAWAQESTRAAIQDLHERHGDWDTVRTAVLGGR